jgi:hypothetical protein
MSTPESHDPVAVNTEDGLCWTRRAVTPAGRGLYAPADVAGPVPELVLASFMELREMGLASVAYAMPMPVGPKAAAAAAEAADWKRLGFEDPHDSPLHRTDRIPHDLPEIGVPFAAESEVEPSGCRYCGIPARVHAQQWKASVGWHKWVLPTQAQIKARMLARRAARTGGAQ